jgi:hypothetical protein
MVRVVDRDRVPAPPGRERLVPVHGGEALSDLELAPGVVDLEPGDAFAADHLGHPQAAPVGVRKVGDAPMRARPAHRLLEPGKLARRPLRRLVDTEREHVDNPRTAGHERVELDARDDDEGASRGGRRAHPVVGDRESVEATSLVVGDEDLRSELAVRRRRVGMERAAKPRPLALERVRHLVG